ncbi:carbohydrate sulfotransferase [Plakobranchus ocellatus]|uniref:Carbohydrate sulfotransferase n=1 Tax=Plakobranchus ocellatus TaxID=259542 RepID=A0AAV3YUA1_9GAST|nr:carbohydrate sulfotransferase [Plakobranchus ocellatus]
MHSEDEVRSITDYNFYIYKWDLENCLTNMELALRLWKTFQVNGYIRMEAAFPKIKIGKKKYRTHESVIAFKEHLKTVLIEHMRQDPLSEEEHYKQRELAVSLAYR